MSKLIIKKGNNNKYRVVIVKNLIDDDGFNLFGNTGRILYQSDGLFTFERDDKEQFKLRSDEFHDFNTSKKDSPVLNPRCLKQ